jgi:isocitrate dehydrogenase
VEQGDQGGVNPSGEFRVKLDLFANIRPAKSRMGVGLTGKPVDLVIFRECTEGFYADRNMYQGIGEFMPTEDVAMAVRKVTARQCQRIARVLSNGHGGGAGRSPQSTRPMSSISRKDCFCAKCARSQRNSRIA